MRWRQDSVTGKMVPVDEAAARKDAGVSVHAGFVPFVSHVDGTLISDPRSLREHNKRNNVVQTSEYGDKHFDDAAKKRADFYQGKHSRKETFARKQEIYDNWIAAERQN